MQRGMTVVPVVGIVWDKNSMNLIANVDEVDAIFDAPLEMFLKVFESRFLEINLFILRICSFFCPYQVTIY